MSEPILRVRDLKLSRGEVQVLRGIDLDVDAGDLVALMGLSGGGKTTALRAIVALEKFDSGTIEVGGVKLDAGAMRRERELKALRRKVGLVFQLHNLFDHLTAMENIVLAPVHVHGIPESDARKHASELLESLGVLHRADAYPRSLSGGEAQRVAIARALAVDPPLLLLDEPTASLDPARTGELGRTLQKLASEGKGLLFTTHDDDFAMEFATKIVVLAEGEVVEVGPPSQVLTSPQHEATKRLLQMHAAK